MEISISKLRVESFSPQFGFFLDLRRNLLLFPDLGWNIPIFEFRHQLGDVRTILTTFLYILLHLVLL